MDLPYTEVVELAARKAKVLELGAADRDVVIKALRAALKARSGKAWSVTGGRGTAWGWIKIRPRKYDGWMSDAECEELGALLGMARVHNQGESIPSSQAYRRVALAQALYGDSLGFTAEPYWD